jgi:hypothetical protein
MELSEFRKKSVASLNPLASTDAETLAMRWAALGTDKALLNQLEVYFQRFVGFGGICIATEKIFAAANKPASNCGGLPTVTFSLSGKAALVAAHIRDALMAGHPQILTYDSDETQANIRRAAVCPRSTCPRTGDPADHDSCDEYPFASTKQGGMSGASVRCVTLRANSGSAQSLGKSWLGAYNVV